MHAVSIRSHDFFVRVSRTRTSISTVWRDSVTWNSFFFWCCMYTPLLACKNTHYYAWYLITIALVVQLCMGMSKRKWMFVISWEKCTHLSLLISPLNTALKEPLIFVTCTWMDIVREIYLVQLSEGCCTMGIRPAVPWILPLTFAALYLHSCWLFFSWLRKRSLKSKVRRVLPWSCGFPLFASKRKKHYWLVWECVRSPLLAEKNIHPTDHFFHLLHIFYSESVKHLIFDSLRNVHVCQIRKISILSLSLFFLKKRSFMTVRGKYFRVLKPWILRITFRMLFSDVPIIIFAVYIPPLIVLYILELIAIVKYRKQAFSSSFFKIFAVLAVVVSLPFCDQMA